MSRFVVAGAILSMWPAAAEADVPLPGTQPEEFQGEDPSFAPLAPSRSCFQCHADYADGTSEPANGWRGSMMGNAARDPVFLAALSVAEDDVPGVGDLCLRCHAPEAWLEGRSEPTDGSALEADDDGVTCDFCHRLIESDPLGLDPSGPYIGNAQFFLSPESTRRGPYADALAEHQTEQSTYLGESRFCGLCHDVTNPLVAWRDEDGAEIGATFPIERTFTEWQRSAFAAEDVRCQTCHMPSVVGRACADSDAPERTMPTHELAGGNAWIPRALTTLHDERLHRAEDWARTEEAARRMLASAATLELEEIAERVTAGGSLELSVRVTNQAGHRLPTGYPEGRRMWLQVEVTDPDGATLWGSGLYDSENATRIEDEQLRAYEVELGVSGEGSTFHFVRNDTIVYDTRIPPRGYAPEPTDQGVLPVGRDYSDGAGGFRHWDVAPYDAPVPCGAQGPLTVRVRLLQQTSSREYIDFLTTTPVTELGIARAATLAEVWEQTGRSEPVLMAELEASVEVDPGDCGDGDADADTDADGDADADGDGDGDGDGDVGTDDGGCCTIAPGAGGRNEAAAAGLLLLVAAIVLRRRGRA